MARWLLVPAMFVLCLFLVSEGFSGDKKKTTITGAVTKVEIEKDAGTITVKTPEKKKKDVVVAEAKEYKVTVGKDTVVEEKGKKKDDPATKKALSDIAKDQTVTVTFEEGKAAEKIVISPKKK